MKDSQNRLDNHLSFIKKVKVHYAKNEFKRQICAEKSNDPSYSVDFSCKSFRIQMIKNTREIKLHILVNFSEQML